MLQRVVRDSTPYERLQPRPAKIGEYLIDQEHKRAEEEAGSVGTNSPATVCNLVHSF